MKILITGGHFSPAYAVIRELKRRKYEIIIAGRKHPFEGDASISLEYAICEKENLPFYEIKTGRFQRKFSSYTISSLLRTPLGFVQALALLVKIRPDAILTFGGYIGLPIAIAGASLNIPVILHEQTQGAGLAARAISKIAKKICISFKDSQNLFPKDKVVFTGNPVREEIFELNKNSDISKELSNTDNKKVIYITGGSTGSHFINYQAEKFIPDLLSKYVVVHQTGESKKFDDFEISRAMRDKLPETKKKNYILRKFIYPDEIGEVFSHASLIISRAGANTIFEIIALGKMCLLIPLPYGQISEQEENAKFVQKLGIGEYIVEREATVENIVKKINEMLVSSSKYTANSKKAKEYFIPDAAKRIVDILESYGKTNG